MSEKTQVKTKAKASAAPRAAHAGPRPAHAVRPPLAASERQPEQPGLAAQVESAGRLGHSLAAVRVSRAASAGFQAGPLVQRQEHPEQEEEDEQKLQMQPEVPRVGLAGGPLPPDAEAAIRQARGGGQSLDGATRTQMGEALGHDFSSVRVHTGAEADALNRQLGARAFTTGMDIFFRQGEYDPGSGSGRQLIAHELAHVVQQKQGLVHAQGSGLTVRPAGDALEGEADALAHKAGRQAPGAASQEQESSTRQPQKQAHLAGLHTPVRSIHRTHHNGPTRAVVQRATYEDMKLAFGVSDAQVDQKIQEIGAQGVRDIGAIFTHLCSYGRTNFSYGGGSRLSDVIAGDNFTCETLSQLLIIISLRLHGAVPAKIARIGDAVMTVASPDGFASRGMIPGPNVQGENRYAFGQGHQVAQINGQEYDPLMGLQAGSILGNSAFMIEGTFVTQGQLSFIVDGVRWYLRSDGTKIAGLTQWKVRAQEGVR